MSPSDKTWTANAQPPWPPIVHQSGASQPSLAAAKGQPQGELCVTSPGGANITRRFGAVLASVLLAAIPTGCNSGTIFDLYVADQTVPCVAGVAKTNCLQVRRDPNAAWEASYTPIDGFNFEPGYFYHLRVEETRIENPPADSPSVRDRLIEVIDKQPGGH